MAQTIDALLGQQALPNGALTITLTTTAAVSANTLIVATVTWWGFATMPTLTFSCPTDGTIVWSTDVMGQINSGYGVGRGSGFSEAGLASGASITGTFSSIAQECYIHGHSRFGADVAIVGSNSASASATAHWTAGSATATANGSVIGSGVNDAGSSTTTPDSGYTEIQDWVNAFHGITMEEVHRTDAISGTAYTAGGVIATGTGNVCGVEAIQKDAIVVGNAARPQMITHVAMGVTR